jgi:hypothetical protein
MNSTEKQKKRIRPKKRKRTARILCRKKKEFWTTQAQFWQRVRELKVIKTQHNPLTGIFVHDNEVSMVILGNAILNLAQPNHLNEVLTARRRMTRRRIKRRTQA